MADQGQGIIHLALYFFVGCVLQICHSAVVPEVSIVPSQGQTAGSPQTHYQQHTGHYPHYHTYPQDPAYTGNSYAVDQTYNPQSGGNLTPGQPAQQQPMTYQDQFPANQATGVYAPYAQQAYHGSMDPTLSQSQGAQTAQTQASQAQMSPSQGQGPPQGQTPGQTQQSQAMSASQPHIPMMPYQQNADPSGQGSQPMNPAPYSYPYTGHFQPQVYAGQPPAGYPNAPSGIMQEPSGYPGTNTAVNADPSGVAGAATAADPNQQAPEPGTPPQGFQQAPVGSSPGQGFQPNVGADPQGFSQTAGSNPAQGFSTGSGPSQGFAPPASSNPAQGFQPIGAPVSSQNQGFAQTPISNPGQSFTPGAPGPPPQGFLQSAGAGGPQNPNVPYSGLPQQNNGINQAGLKAADVGSQTAPGNNPADVPASSGVSTQRQPAYKGHLTNAVQYNLADTKTGAFAPNGAADPQSNMVVGGQPGFTQSQGPPAGGSSPAGFAYTPQQPPSPVQQYQSGPYLGQSPAAGSGPQSYPGRGVYPYQPQYPGQPPYPGPMSPYPGPGGMAYTDQQGRPLYPAPKQAMNPAQQQDPQAGPNQRQYPQDKANQQQQQQQHGHHHHHHHHQYHPGNGYPPNNNMKTSTTTLMPETTQAASTFPPDLRCFSQNECELGCCYASDGSILIDNLGPFSSNTPRKEGYCYTKTTTVPGDGCLPGICPCQGMDQICISVPSENATIPPLMGDLAEGGVTGNPKCYTSDQQMQIIDWLKKLDTIVTVCRIDGNCPLTMMH